MGTVVTLPQRVRIVPQKREGAPRETHRICCGRIQGEAAPSGETSFESAEPIPMHQASAEAVGAQRMSQLKR